MKQFLQKRGVHFLASALMFMVSGCSLNFDEGGGYYVGSYAGDTEDSTEDQLLVSGSGEMLVFEYNTLTFTAQLNWKDGNYYFAPDPDGTISGNKIICAATVSSYEVEGDCFRDRQVCHFSFYETWSDLEDKDAYYLSDSSCKTAAAVGPFLVPLDAPVCGDDPFPACPTDDLFPGGPADDSAGAEVVGGLTAALCEAAARCDATLSYNPCMTAMGGEDGRQIWDNFGVSSSENELTTAEVLEAVNEGSITVNDAALGDCLGELAGTCDNEGETVSVGDYSNIENLIPEEGPCSSVLISEGDES